MKVKELVDLLLKMDQEADVFMRSDIEESIDGIKDVRLWDGCGTKGDCPRYPDEMLPTDVMIHSEKPFVY